VKEICHPAYSGNQATVENAVSADDGHYGNKRWYGEKLIMHDVAQNGN
jgi:ribosomal protein L31